MVQAVHEGLDDRCGVIDLGLQQLTRTLPQTNQGVIGQHHVDEHREGTADQRRDQSVDRRAHLGVPTDVDQEHDRRRKCSTHRHVSESRYRSSQAEHDHREHGGRQPRWMPDQGHDRRCRDARRIARHAPDTPGVGVGGLRTQHHENGQWNPVAVRNVGEAFHRHPGSCRGGKSDRVPQDGRFPRQVRSDRRGGRPNHRQRTVAPEPRDALRSWGELAETQRDGFPELVGKTMRQCHVRHRPPCRPRPRRAACRRSRRA